MPSPPSWSHLHQSDFSTSNSAHCLSYRCAYCGTDRSDRWTDGSTYGLAERSAYCGTDGSTAALPASISASSLYKVLHLQREGKVVAAERLLDSTLKPLSPPASSPLGAVGALLYLWRSRSRAGIGKRHEAEMDLRNQIANVQNEKRIMAEMENEFVVQVTDAAPTWVT